MENYDPYTAGYFIGIFMAVLLIPMLIVWVISVVGMWRVYEKAGKPGWASIIPIYNVIVMLEIIGKPMLWLLLLLIPCVNIVVGIWMINLLSKSYGQSEGFTIGLIFLPFIFYPVLGFGNYRYLGPAGAGFAGHNPYDPSTGYTDPFNPPPPPQQY
jgi:ABC-type sulfate transport system permease subunit